MTRLPVVSAVNPVSAPSGSLLGAWLRTRSMLVASLKLADSARASPGGQGHEHDNRQYERRDVQHPAGSCHYGFGESG